MDKIHLITLVIATIGAIGGLILIFLQKKGKIKPVLTQTTNGLRFVGGGHILFWATLLGAVTLGNYSKVFTLAYIFVFSGLYYLIRKKD